MDLSEEWNKLINENEKLRAENAELRHALSMAVTQNECDMVMTGDELRKCYRALRPEASSCFSKEAGKE